MTSEVKRAIVAGHGAFAEGLISAVGQITGIADRFVGVSNAGLTPAGLEEALRAALSSSGARVVFTDLPAGSCTIAARRIARGDAGLTVVTGVALPTLLSFAFGADLESATAQGRAALAIVEAPRVT